MHLVQYDVRVIGQCFSGNQFLQEYTSCAICDSCVVVSFALQTNLLGEVRLYVRRRTWQGFILTYLIADQMW